MFDVPNLDDMSTDPKDYFKAQVVLLQLAYYAQKKGYAMCQRMKGNIGMALEIERDCQAIYDSLPEWARW